MCLALDLFLHKHWQRTFTLKQNKSPSPPRGRPIHTIDSDIHAHIDKRMDLPSITQNRSNSLKCRELHSNLASIAQFCVSCGKKENGSRQKCAWTMNFGVKGELSQNKSRPFDHFFCGLKPFSSIPADVWRSMVTQSLANMIDCIWLAANNVQTELHKNSLGMNTHRSFCSKRVGDSFGCVHSQFKCVTLIVMPLTSSNSGQCDKHKDKMNNILPACQKTACMSVLFCGRGDVLCLFQTICDFCVSV